MHRKEELHLSHSEIVTFSYRFCGYHDCPSGYAYGPTVRDEYILHFVNRGTGYYRINKNTFRVTQGSSFVLFPGYILHYQADKADPWEYYWVAFDGPEVRSILEKVGVHPANPVVVHEQPAVMRKLFQDTLASAARQNLQADFDTMSLFYRILAQVARDGASTAEFRKDGTRAESYDEHIQNAVAYIQENYFDHGISVDTIARHVFLERSYFSTIFKEHMGIPPNHFLIKVRIENACRMLADSSMSIKKVAYSVGYREQGYFDKVFRKYMRLSPSEYRDSVRRAIDGSGDLTDIPERLDKSFFS